MDAGRISVRYAKALYGYAVDQKKEKEIYEEMKLVSDVFFLLPKLTLALENPRISNNKKKEFILEAAGTNVSPEFDRFVDLVISHKREDYFHLISLKYQDIFRKANGIVIGKLTTAQPVEEKVEERMKAMVAEASKREVDFNTVVNPDLLGGFILQIGTYQIDASLSGQLKRIKDSLLRTSHDE